MKPHYSHIFTMSILLSCLLINTLFAQDTHVQMSFSSTKLTMKNGEIESIIVKIENKTALPFSGQLLIKGNSGISIVSKDNQALTLESGASKYVSVQLLLEKSAKAGEKGVSFRLEDTQKRHLITKEIPVSVSPLKSMRTEILSSISLLPAAGNVLDIPIRIINGGNIDQTVKVIVSFPTAANEGSNNSHTLFVHSYSDTIINITKKITRSIAQREELKINIIGVYGNGDLFSSQALNLLSPKSSARFNLDNRINTSNLNQMTAGIMNLGSLSEAYYLRGNVDFQRGKTKGGVHLDMVNWTNGLTIQNTYIELEHNKIGTRVGSITKYGDQSLYGKGAEVFFNDTASGYSFSAGYIKKGYDLLSSYDFNLGDAVWVSADRSLENGSLSTIITREKDLYNRADNKTIVNTATFKLKNEMAASFKVGLGHVQDIQDQTNSHPSLLVRGAISGKLSKDVFISSENSYSSSYFPGNNRGSINIAQRINLNLPKSSIWASYRFYRFAPKYLLSSIFFSSNTSNHYVNLGSSGTIGTFNYSLGPFYTQEIGSWNWMNPKDIRRLNGLGLNGILNWVPMESKQNFNFQLDAGRSWMDLNGKEGLQFRGTLNWSYRNFRIMSSAQHGTFYLYETFRNQQSDKKQTRYQISPNYSQSLFRNKLRLEAGMIYIVDREITNLLYSGNVNYVLKNTEFFATAQVSKYGQSDFYQNFQVGITQKLPSFSRLSPEKPGSMNLFVFEDKNANGIFDPGETTAANHLVYVNNKPFLTSQKGQITYKGLPKGQYRIDAPVKNGWFINTELINLEPKQLVNLTIPLQESGVVKGHIEYQTGNELIEFSVNKVLSNLRILAINETGNAIETRTSDKGNFILFLPPGNYTLSVIGLPEKVESVDDKQIINVSVDKPIEDIVFPLRVKEQKVEIKRFTSK